MQPIISVSRGAQPNHLTSLCLGIALLAGSGGSPLVAAEKSSDLRTLPAPKRIVVPKLRGPVVIDGDISEAVWERAVLLKPFSLNDGSGPGREPTEVRVWYDDAALYLGW